MITDIIGISWVALTPLTGAVNRANSGFYLDQWKRSTTSTSKQACYNFLRYRIESGIFR